MKKQKNNKNQLKKETNRWRPKKIFVSKKPKTKQEWPGRPKKNIENTKPKVKFTTPPEENKVKDAIIFAMFIISLLVFCFSIYIAQNKKKEQKELFDSIRETTTTGNITTNIDNNQNESWNIQQSTTNNTITNTNESQIIESFYTAINEQKFLDIYSMIDDKLKQSSTIRTYFSSKRLQRFLNNIQNNTVEYTIKTTEIWPSTNINYSISYTLANGSGYTEDRVATLINKGDSYRIGKIMCTTPWCSKMPFFNPGRYNIK